ncbi:MAG: site-specific integrase [Candidatus Thermoplasmatota archaeon]|jgi:integrase|nr:site-specific integrase [Candidatus Thermoplasmatota archaeon]
MPKEKYKILLDDEDVKRWNENVNAGSSITGEVYLRTLGLYCELQNTNPRKVIQDAKKGKLRNDFMDFVRRLEKEGKAGSYIVRFKKVLSSWTRFNDVQISFKSVKIKEAFRNPTVEDERVPSPEELSKIITVATDRAKVSISLMAFSGLRIESIGDFKGNDGLILSDLPELKISQDKVEFEKLPTIVKVRSTLSKARHEYTTFLSQEGAAYVKKYLESRMKDGEKLIGSSPLVAIEGNPRTVHRRLRTQLVSREIRKAIRGLGYTWRPYVLRAYFSTALDTCENKGLVSHNWREYWTGHKGDISARYSTNKKLTQDKLEEMRSTYLKCAPYLETGRRPLSEEEKEELNKDSKRWYLTIMGFGNKEIEDEKLLELSPEDLQKKVREKLNMATNNGHKQKVISTKEVKHYIEDLGWEFIKDLGDKEAIVKLPERG